MPFRGLLVSVKGPLLWSASFYRFRRFFQDYLGFVNAVVRDAGKFAKLLFGNYLLLP
jgi:hypothetical protein